MNESEEQYHLNNLEQDKIIWKGGIGKDFMGYQPYFRRFITFFRKGVKDRFTIDDLHTDIFNELAEIDIKKVMNQLKYHGAKINEEEQNGKLVYKLQDLGSFLNSLSFQHQWSRDYSITELRAIEDSVKEELEKNRKEKHKALIEQDVLRPTMPLSEKIADLIRRREIFSNRRKKLPFIRVYNDLIQSNEASFKMGESVPIPDNIYIEGTGTPSDEYIITAGLKQICTYNLYIELFDLKLKELNDLELSELQSSKKESKQQTGFNLGFSEPQLEALHQALIDKGYLDKNTKQAHFKNAFNGKELIDFEPLKWKVPTKGAIFIKYYFGDEKNFWSKWKFLFMPARYTTLLSQSIKKNDTFNQVTKEITIIDTSIKNIDCIDSK